MCPSFPDDDMQIRQLMLPIIIWEFPVNNTIITRWPLWRFKA